MSKILMVVYSLAGTAGRLAELLGSQQGWQVAEIAETQPRRGLPGTWRCVLDFIFRSHPLVSLIWVGRFAGPMRSFVARRRDHLPDIAVISIMGGRGASSAAAEIASLVGKPPSSARPSAREVEDRACADRLRFVGAAVRGAPSAVVPGGLKVDHPAAVQFRHVFALAGRLPLHCSSCATGDWPVRRYEPPRGPPRLQDHGERTTT